MKERDEEIFYDKIKKALDSSLKIHLRLRDASWRNGYVLKTFADFFMFKDDFNEEEPIFYIELKNVKPCVEEKKGG